MDAGCNSKLQKSHRLGAQEKIAAIAPGVAAFLLILALSWACSLAAGQKWTVGAEEFTVPAHTRARGDSSNVLHAYVWYPAAPNARPSLHFIGPPGHPLFKMGAWAEDAPMASSPRRFPLVVLSHGTGGSTDQLAWLARRLAPNGYVAAGVDHPGNSVSKYTPQGFILWWLRAQDVTTLITSLLRNPHFGDRIDPRRIGAAGFSLGGYSVLELAGARTSFAQYLAFCHSPERNSFCGGPPEFPGLAKLFNRLEKTDARFREALKHDGDSYRDPRIRAVFAIEPALGEAVTDASLGSITIPVAIVAGPGTNPVSPPLATNARKFARLIPTARLTILPGDIQHYDFLAVCTSYGKNRLPARLCSDAPGVNRTAVHRETSRLAVSFFGRYLRPSGAQPARVTNQPGGLQ